MVIMVIILRGCVAVSGSTRKPCLTSGVQAGRSSEEDAAAGVHVAVSFYNRLDRSARGDLSSPLPLPPVRLRAEYGGKPGRKMM